MKITKTPSVTSTVPPSGSPRLQAGINLLEVLIASLVLSIGLLGLAGMQVASLKSTQNSVQKQQATFLIHDLLERMRGNRAGVIAAAYNDTAAISCGTLPAKNCAGVVQCNSAEMAEFDLYTIMCGGANSTTSGVSNQLLDSQLTITCPTGSCDTGVRIDLQWAERNEKTGQDAATDLNAFAITLDAII